jgi:hypothetical protein
MQEVVASGISTRFRKLSLSEGQITHVLLTRSPLVYPRRSLTARLACVKHAASVRPEPGSNSPLKNNTTTHTQKREPQKKRIPAENDTLTITCQKLSITTKEPSHPHPKKGEEIGRKLIRRLYDTLLSSQTSQAHQPTTQPGSRPGQPHQTYRFPRGLANRGDSLFPTWPAPHMSFLPN